MSRGIKAGLEIRGTEGASPATWHAVIPSVDVDEVPNRTLFALLAGYPSRLGLKPLLPLRGLPENVTQPIKESYDEWGDAVYDASWVSYKELVATVERLTAAIEDLARGQGMDEHNLLRLHRGVSIDAVIAFLGVYHARGFETRMVFWFTSL